MERGSKPCERMSLLSCSIALFLPMTNLPVLIVRLDSHWLERNVFGIAWIDVETAHSNGRARRRQTWTRMRLAIGDVPGQNPIADRLRWSPWFYMTEATRLLAEKFLELVPSKSKLIAALERQPFELSIDIGLVIDRILLPA